MDNYRLWLYPEEEQLVLALTPEGTAETAFSLRDTPHVLFDPTRARHMAGVLLAWATVASDRGGQDDDGKANESQ